MYNALLIIYFEINKLYLFYKIVIEICIILYIRFLKSSFSSSFTMIHLIYSFLLEKRLVKIFLMETLFKFDVFTKNNNKMLVIEKKLSYRLKICSNIYNSTILT